MEIFLRYNVHYLVFQIVSNHMKEVLLNGYEELPVTVNFSPSSLGYINAVIHIRLIGTAIRHCVSLVFWCVVHAQIMRSIALLNVCCSFALFHHP